MQINIRRFKCCLLSLGSLNRLSWVCIEKPLRCSYWHTQEFKNTWFKQVVELCIFFSLFWVYFTKTEAHLLRDKQFKAGYAFLICFSWSDDCPFKLFKVVIFGKKGGPWTFHHPTLENPLKKKIDTEWKKK